MLRTRSIRPAPSRDAAAPRGSTAVLFPAWRGRPLTLSRALYGTFPVFRATFDDVCRAVDGILAVPLAAVVFAPEDGVDGHLLARTEYGQSALFAYEVALYRLWQARGGQARAVAGDGVGALAAAYASGALTLGSAAGRSVAERSTAERAPVPPSGPVPGPSSAAASVPASVTACGPAPGLSSVPASGPVLGLSSDLAAEPVSAAADRLRRAGHVTLLECGPAEHRPVTVGDVPGLLAALSALQRPAPGSRRGA
ncbi:acyltransferase domain-containing protein [Streptomyces sp. NPDC002701]|uniref:acyltransferase domain-containing protein n=1 Tax=Streptomyces sp. NPDC002701 TaxID=3364661 RepID=UPI003699977D